MEKAEILLTILFVICLGSINSLLSYFLEYCFWDGSIFSKWLPILAKINLKLFDSKTLNSMASAKNNPQYDNMLVQNAQQMFFYKILGGCSICTNVWLGFITFTFIHIFIHISFWYAIPYLLFSSFILRKLLNS